METRKKQLFETITSEDMAQSIKIGRERKSRIVQQIHVTEDKLAYEGTNQKVTAQDQDVTVLRELLMQIVKSYTNNHDHLSIEAFLPNPSNRLLVFVIQSEQADFKKLVGSQGRNARALQALMREIGTGLDLKIDTRIKSPVGNIQESGENPPFDESTTFDGEPMATIIQVVVSLMTKAPCRVRHVNMAGMTAFLCESAEPPTDHQQAVIRQLFMLPGNKVRRQFSVEFV